MHELFVMQEGSGPPVLLLHGLLSNHRQMDPLMPALKGYTVYRVDLFGCGNSSKLPTPDIVEENAAHLLQLCVKHNIDTVISYSISGMVALAMQLPNTVFISTFAQSPFSEGPFKVLQPKEDAVQDFLIRYRDHIHAVLAKIRTKAMPGIPEASMECAIHYMMAARIDHREQASSLNHVLCVHGTKDQLINVKLGENLAQAAHAQLVLVPEDHGTVLGNETVQNAIRDFLANR